MMVWDIGEQFPVRNESKSMDIDAQVNQHQCYGTGDFVVALK